MFDTVWIEKLKPLVDRDHFTREAIQNRGTLHDTYHKELEKVHIENSVQLEHFIQQNGFPVISNAGSEGVRLSWLIIQHAISRPEFMRECLLQIRLACAANDYPKDLLAYLEDRIAFFEGRGQLYGTNLDWIEGELVPTLIEDPARLEDRRRAMGLAPLVSQATPFERPPRDSEKKQLEFEIWLKKTGWRP